jgi:hypothetical protein
LLFSGSERNGALISASEIGLNLKEDTWRQRQYFGLS